MGTDISLVRRRGVNEQPFAPLPVFGFFDEIKEISTISAIHVLEFFSDEDVTGPSECAAYTLRTCY